jgi:limonene-1,2-epoxide hydrolase
VAPDGRAEANDELVRDFMAAWERRDTGFILDCLTEDAVYHSVPLTPIVKGRHRRVGETVRRRAAGRLEVRHQVASGDVVMNERTDLITRNGGPVTLPICGVFEMQEGRIRAWREYFDLTPAKAAYEQT